MSKSNPMPEEFAKAVAQLVISYLSAPTPERVASLTPRKIIVPRRKQTPRARRRIKLQ